MSAKIPYKTSYAKDIESWLVDGNTSAQWMKKMKISKDAFYRFYKEYPSFRDAVESGNQSRGYKFNPEYIVSLNAAIEAGLSWTRWQRSLKKEFDLPREIPASILLHWQDRYPDFQPRKLLPKTGRKSHYKPEYCEMIIEAFSHGSTLQAFASQIGKNLGTLDNWFKAHSEFAESYRVAKVKSQEYFERKVQRIATGERFSEDAEAYEAKADSQTLRWLMERRFTQYNPNTAKEDAVDLQEKSAEEQFKQIDYSALSDEQLAALADISQTLEKAKQVSEAQKQKDIEVKNSASFTKFDD